jgi:toxin ParE1/3/4
MKVVYTEEALENLAGTLTYISSNYPTVYEAFQIRLQSVISRISRWPDSAQQVAGRPGVRVAPLLRFPYKVFYRRTGETIEILYVHHSARDEP